VKRGTKAAKQTAREWESALSVQEFVDESGYDEQDLQYREWMLHLERDDGIPNDFNAECGAGFDAEWVADFDFSPLIDSAEDKWRDGEKKRLARLGWVDAWDDENWHSGSDGEWWDVGEEELR